MKQALLIILCAGIATYVRAGESGKAVSAGIFGGAGISFIDADSASLQLFEPTAEEEDLISPTGGVEVDFRLGRFGGVVGGMRIDQRGHYTEETSVEFIGNPYLHRFESRVVLTYLTVPLYGYARYSIGAHEVRLRAGFAAALLTKSSVDWKIDGQDVNDGVYAPDARFRSYEMRASAGLEYGFNFAGVGVFLGGLYDYGLQDITKRPSGEARTSAACGYIGFRKYFKISGEGAD